ncbi:LOW QUALITY PROTEIN: RNA recognition domain-containing protein [Colletotrichum tofieldiae]|nr:LOW QUALITY PROTEIN: RNA recognition domain-containing protein [Colletotrichum tofieldiae]
MPFSPQGKERGTFLTKPHFAQPFFQQVAKLGHYFFFARCAPARPPYLLLPPVLRNETTFEENHTTTAIAILRFSLQDGFRPPVAALEAALKAISDYKAPGVTGTRIAAMTSICVENVQYESVLIQKLFTYFKMASPPYKLGILYVVDSVIRKWLEQARSRQQVSDENAADGTYGAGAHRLTMLMPNLIDDLLRALPEGYKDKLHKLIEIWRKGSTFPTEMIESFQSKLDATPASAPNLVERMGYNKPVVPPSAPAPMPTPDATNILANLQNLARASQQQGQNGIQGQNQGQPQYGGQGHNNGQHQNGNQNYNQPQVPAQTQSNPQVPINLQNLLSRLQSVTPQQQQPPVPPINSQQFPYSMPPFTSGTPTTSAPASYPLPSTQPQPQPVGMQFPSLPQMPQMPQMPQWPQMPQMSQMPPMPQPPAGVPLSSTQQLAMFQTLLSQGITADKFAAMLAAVNGGQNGAVPMASAAPAAPVSSGPSAAHNYYTPGQGYGGSAQPSANLDQHRYNDRTRSRTDTRVALDPDRPVVTGSRAALLKAAVTTALTMVIAPLTGAAMIVETAVETMTIRSPPPSRDGGPSNSSRHGSNDRWIEYDQSLPAGHIKVLSRTLFVGGVNMPERQVREIFSRYGKVQTVIVNKEKRHAFVKMISRPDAVRAKEAMEKLAEEQQHSDAQSLRTRWGVGFGPRDASDYSNGVSVIPIELLTEADRKWLLTAEYGGSGGRPIVPGLVVEEPDIEIGAGVSSKAISRRMQTDKSGNHGPRSTRGGRDASRDDPGRWRRSRDRDNRRDDRRDDKKVSGANAQPLPQQFPFGIGTLPNGMPAYPPGFTFPASKSN